jgi:hypothetical protein
MFSNGITAKEAFEKAKEETIAIYGDDSYSYPILQKKEFKEFSTDITEINKIYEDKVESLGFFQKKKKERMENEKFHFKTRSKRTGKDKATAIAHFLIEIEPEEINAPEKPAGIIKVLKNEWLIFGFINE